MIQTYQTKQCYLKITFIHIGMFMKVLKVHGRSLYQKKGESESVNHSELIMLANFLRLQDHFAASLLLEHENLILPFLELAGCSQPYTILQKERKKEIKISACVIKIIKIKKKTNTPKSGIEQTLLTTDASSRACNCYLIQGRNITSLKNSKEKKKREGQRIEFYLHHHCFQTIDQMQQKHYSQTMQNVQELCEMM